MGCRSFFTPSKTSLIYFDSDRSLFYAPAPRLVCADHLNGVDSDRLDFRVNPKLLRE